MPAGRPTDYTPELCGKVRKLLRKGLSIEEIGLELDTGYKTLYTWMDKYPEFRQAIDEGRDLSKGWWIKKGRKSLHDKTLNSRVYEINMRNRFDWDKKHDNTEEDNKSLMQKLIDKL